LNLIVDIITIFAICLLLFGAVVFLMLIYSTVVKPEVIVNQPQFDRDLFVERSSGNRGGDRNILTETLVIGAQIVLMVLNFGAVLGIATTIGVVVQQWPERAIVNTPIPIATSTVTATPATPTTTTATLAPTPPATGQPIGDVGATPVFVTSTVEAPTGPDPFPTRVVTVVPSPTLTPTPLPTATPRPTYVPPPQVDPGRETALAELINAQRPIGGCKPLNYSVELANAARRHSVDMANNGVELHVGSDGSTVNDRIRDAGYRKRGYGSDGWWIELIFPLPAEAGAADVPVSIWMDGEDGPNRKAILDCENQDIGVGYVQGADGQHYWTVIMADGLPPR
jgi:uncharacterized protein YkwD